MKSVTNPFPEQGEPKSLPPHSAFPALAAAILAMGIYAVTLGGTYVYDDIGIVRDDPRVLQPHLWYRLWTTDYFDGGLDNLYRPLVSSSYAIEWWLHGDRPWIFHAVNILLHALATIGVVELTRRSLRGSPVKNAAGFIAGALFALHPVHVEAVANIVGRAELACTAALLAGLVILCRRPTTSGRVLAVFASGIIALLCKEQGILAPLLWIFSIWWIWRWPADSSSPLPPDSRERSAFQLLLLITCWGWAIYLMGREHFLRFEWARSFLDPKIQPLVASFGTDRVLMPVVLVGRYTALMFWPQYLSVDYGADVIGSHVHGSDPYLWAGLLAIGIWGAGVLISWRRNSRFILFCLMAMAVTYSVISNLLTLIAVNFAERLIYLPSAFFLMIAGVLIARIAPKPRAIIVFVMLALSAGKTVTAARSWNNPLALFQAGVQSQPKSVQLLFLVAQEYHKQGNDTAADATLAKACKVYPAYWLTWYRRALVAMDGGHFDDASKYLVIAYRLKPHPLTAAAFDRLTRLRAATQPLIPH